MPKIAVLISFSGAGGVERMVFNLVKQFGDKGVAVDLLLIRASGPHLQDLPPQVNLVPLKAKHTLTAIPELIRYFRKARPKQMLVAKDRAARAALIARGLAGANTRIVVRLGTNLSRALEQKTALSRWWRLAPMKQIYSCADAVVAVSEGVRQDTLAITALPESRVHVIRNPVVTDELDRQSHLAVEHAWLADDIGSSNVPVVMAAGRLSYQKGFDVLIRAFAELVKQHPARLLILGDGASRGELEMLAQELGVGELVDFPGFQSDIYSWLAKADLFVLSSRWEGSPNVLTEALALGVPSVSTRCPSGPDEILQEGKYGALVEVDDWQAMSKAMLDTLDNPKPREFLQEAVFEYKDTISAERYLNLLLDNKP